MITDQIQGRERLKLLMLEAKEQENLAMKVTTPLPHIDPSPTPRTHTTHSHTSHTPFAHTTVALKATMKKYEDEDAAKAARRQVEVGHAYIAFPVPWCLVGATNLPHSVPPTGHSHVPTSRLAHTYL